MLNVAFRLNRWSRGRTFSFVPPDGKFILADYRYSPSGSSSHSTTSVTKDNIPIPFVIKSNFDLLDYGGEITIVHFNYSMFIETLFSSIGSFDITLTSRLNARNLENIVVQLNLGEGASGIKCIAARGTGGLGRGGVNALDSGIGGSSGASWAFDSRKRVCPAHKNAPRSNPDPDSTSQVLKWEISSAPPTSSWNLQGSFSTQLVFYTIMDSLSFLVDMTGGNTGRSRLAHHTLCRCNSKSSRTRSHH
jgi:AP-3 complex subunit mu